MATIVAVDNDETVRNFLKDALQMKGHTVYAFKDPQTALDAVEVEGVDLIIADFRSASQGKSMVRSVKKRNFRKPVILTTAFLAEDIRREAFCPWVQEIFEKPFILSTFLEAVEQGIGRNIAVPA